MQEIETLEYRLSSNLFGYELTRTDVEGSVFISLNPVISGREEVEFYYHSKVMNTRNPNTQGGLKPCMCMC